MYSREWESLLYHFPVCVFQKLVDTLPFKTFLSTHLCYIERLYTVGKIISSKILKIFFWKLKNEEEKMKIFSAGPKISNWYFLEYLNFTDSKSYIFLGSKTLQRGVKMAKKGQSGPTSFSLYYKLHLILFTENLGWKNDSKPHFWKIKKQISKPF